MEFRFDINEMFRQPIVQIGHTLLPAGFKGDKRQLWDTISKVTDVVNAMGAASANAQGLSKCITTADRLRNSEQQILYLLIDSAGNQGKGAVTGMLKTGRKGLYVFDRDGHDYQVQSPCVLDFYVHESRQRSGLGRKIFEFMLKKEDVDPQKLAIDRPSDKFLAFLNKHYALKDPIRQMNNFVVYDGFFPKAKDAERSPIGELSHRSTNGLQTQMLTAPYGRYGAPRPLCSMGQIIHNQSATVAGSEQSGSCFASNVNDTTVLCQHGPDAASHGTVAEPSDKFEYYWPFGEPSEYPARERCFQNTAVPTTMYHIMQPEQNSGQMHQAPSLGFYVGTRNCKCCPKHDQTQQQILQNQLQQQQNQMYLNYIKNLQAFNERYFWDQYNWQWWANMMQNSHGLPFSRPYYFIPNHGPQVTTIMPRNSSVSNVQVSLNTNVKTESPAEEVIPEEQQSDLLNDNVGTLNAEPAEKPVICPVHTCIREKPGISFKRCDCHLTSPLVSSNATHSPLPPTAEDTPVSVVSSQQLATSKGLEDTIELTTSDQQISHYDKLLAAPNHTESSVRHVNPVFGLPSKKSQCIVHETSTASGDKHDVCIIQKPEIPPAIPCEQHDSGYGETIVFEPLQPSIPLHRSSKPSLNDSKKRSKIANLNKSIPGTDSLQSKQLAPKRVPRTLQVYKAETPRNKIDAIGSFVGLEPSSKLPRVVRMTTSKARSTKSASGIISTAPTSCKIKEQQPNHLLRKQSAIINQLLATIQ